MAVTRVGFRTVLNTTVNDAAYVAASAFPVVGGADHVLVVVVQLSEATANAAGRLVCSANGTPMTLAAERVHDAGGSRPQAAIFYTVDPPAGDTTISVQGTGGDNYRACVLTAIEYAGVNAAAPVADKHTLQGTVFAYDHSYAPKAAGNVVVSSANTRFGDQNPWTPDPAVNELVDASTGATATNDETVFVGEHLATGTDPVDVGAVSTNDNDMVFVVVEFAQSSGGGAPGIEPGPVAATPVAPAIGITASTLLGLGGVAAAPVAPAMTLAATTRILPDGLAATPVVPNLTIAQADAIELSGLAAAPVAPSVAIVAATAVTPGRVVAQPFVPALVLSALTVVGPAPLAAQPGLPALTIQARATIAPAGLAAMPLSPAVALNVSTEVVPGGVSAVPLAPKIAISLAPYAPSAWRTITLAAEPRSISSEDHMRTWPTKDPDDTLDYAIDWVASLDQGDALVGVEWIVPDGLTGGESGWLGEVAYVWLSGGTAGQSYRVTCRITTEAGRVLDRSGTLRVAER